MTDKEKIKQWINGLSKLVISFYPESIVKDLKLDLEGVTQILKELSNEGILETIYHCDCECGWNDLFERPNDVETEYPWCGKELDEDDVYLKFKVVRDNGNKLNAGQDVISDSIVKNLDNVEDSLDIVSTHLDKVGKHLDDSFDKAGKHMDDLTLSFIDKSDIQVNHYLRNLDDHLNNTLNKMDNNFDSINKSLDSTIGTFNSIDNSLTNIENNLKYIKKNRIKDITTTVISNIVTIVFCIGLIILLNKIF